MNLESVRSYLLSKRGSSEGLPFGPGALVYKVGAKMFALVSPGSKPLQINLKCDPNEALTLRATFAAVRPGYHMNKEHWNTVCLDGSIPDALILRMIDDSYNLVLSKLSKVVRGQIGKLKEESNSR